MIIKTKRTMWWTTPRLWTSPTSQVTTDKKVDGSPNIAKGKTDPKFNSGVVRLVTAINSMQHLFELLTV